jgi:hypothetical protein
LQECSAIGHSTDAVYRLMRSKTANWARLVKGLSPEDAVALYGKRWDIEVFFNVCKSYLRLTGEFRQTSYEAIAAHTAIVCIRYMLLAVEKRQSIDFRDAPGDIFFAICDEVKDIVFAEVICALIKQLGALFHGEVGLSQDQLMLYARTFVGALPTYMHSRLNSMLSPDISAA